MMKKLRLVWLLVAGLSVLAGCASRQNEQGSFRPGGGIAEYREITDKATHAIERALASLDTVAGQSNGCSPEALKALSADVQYLQVESVQTRARAQAIIARGDGYFERFHETLATVEDPKQAALIQKQRPQLEEKFRELKRSSQEVQAVFKPFLDRLRGLRNSLETDPASLLTNPSQKSLAETRSNGSLLLEHLARIREQLDAMKTMITLPGTPNQ